MRLWRSWFASVLLLAACSETLTESPVPSKYVKYSCDISTVNLVMEQGAPQVGLDCPGGYVRCHDTRKRMASDAWGNAGLLLLQGYESGRFYAFDLACPYCYAVGASAATKYRALEMDDEGMKAVCKSCDSEFGAIFWGSPAPTAGPANQNNYTLRQYKASLLGERLIVSN